MTEVRAAETSTGQAFTTLLDRSRVSTVAGVPKLDRPFRGEARRVPAVAGREDAVEQVDPGGDRVEDVLGAAHAHEVSWAVLRQVAGGHLEGESDLIASLPDAHPSHRVAVEV